MKLISVNIRFDNPNDGQHAWPNRKGVLCRSLLNFSPDLIGTQEGRFPQITELQKLLPEYEIVDHHRQWIAERMYPTIFMKKATLVRIDSGDIWLSQTPHIAGSISFQSMFPRLCTWMRGKFLATGKSFILANIHLDHVLTQTRLEQIKVFIQEIKKIWQENDLFILMGDFNEGPKGDVRKLLLQAFPRIYDPWCYMQIPEQSSHHKFNGLTHLGQRIDWILLDQSLSVQEIYLDEGHESFIYPSDHFPLKCTLQS